jgi:hypothetical protein
MRNSLISRIGSEWNRKVPNVTLSGVECHSSSGAKHRRRSTPITFLAGCSTTSVLGAFRTHKVELIYFASGVFKKS